MITLYLSIIIIGLVIGSFLNVIILRFDDLRSVLVGRSHCVQCKRNLVWYELIPVLSYIALWGKCRTCKKKISVQYPLVEAGTALVFTLLYWKFGLTLEFAFLAIISAILIVIFVYDMLNQQISDLLVVAASVLWITYLIINYFVVGHTFAPFLSSLYGAIALGGFLGLMVLISHERWMGSGDVGLGALLGLLLGWPNIIVATFLAFTIGAVIGLILIALKLSKFQSKLPFAPFLILGFYLALIWGLQLISWYSNLIF